MNHLKLHFLILLPCIAFTAPPGTPLWQIAAQNESLLLSIESLACTIEENNIDYASNVDELLISACLNNSLIEEMASKSEIISPSGQGSPEESLSKACIIESATDTVSDNSLVDVLATLGTPISAEDIGSSGFTISSPGVYRLCETISFAPGATNMSAITIDADGVLLDLNGNTIEQTNGTADTIGVSIAANRNNITISNGTINNVTDDGILVNTGCTFITMANIRIDSTGANGITFSSPSSNFILKDCFVSNSGSVGIDFTDATNVDMQNVICSNPTGNALNLTTCTAVNCKNCSFFSNSAIGIAASGSSQLQLANCIVTQGTTGISLNNCSSSLITNCHVLAPSTSSITLSGTSNNNVILRNVVTASTNGMVIEDTAGNNIIKDNFAQMNSTNNIVETSSNPNTYLGNWALSETFAANYVPDQSDISQKGVIQNEAMMMPFPTKWQNISMQVV